jgi:exodeoxyribonuclease V alpha subunit
VGLIQTDDPGLSDNSEPVDHPELTDDARLTQDPVLFAAFCEAGLWPGLGRTIAGRLAENGIQRLTDVTEAALREVQGVPPARAQRLTRSLVSATDRWDVATLLYSAGLPLRQAASVVAALGPGTGQQLKDDPWRLLDGGGRLAAADRLASSLGIPSSSPLRGPAVVVEELAKAARNGHTAQDLHGVLMSVRQESVPDPAAALQAAITRGAVDVDGPTAALEPLARAEADLARGLLRLIATRRPVSGQQELGEEPDSGLQVELDEDQEKAAHRALRHGVSVLTGGPGTGKSRTVGAMLALAEAADRRVALAAPTGRAAKRLEELTGHSASTLHRLLGAQGPVTGEPTFARSQAWPLDADLVVVDEASMLDVQLAAALVDACSDGTHLVLVGDVDQLPSVGAGRVLDDLITSKVAPVTALQRLYRQDAGGTIARLAASIRDGQLPEPEPGREVVVVPASGAQEAAHRVTQLVTDSIPRALQIPTEEIQVVTPVHRGPAGTDALNAVLKGRLNPGPGAHDGFDPGDRVVAIANYYPFDGSAGFANGEVGVVQGPEPAAAKTEKTSGEKASVPRPPGLIVQFPSGPVTVPVGALIDLRHGWAITVHRAQGSEWPAVVAVFPPEATPMLSRPLIYTGLTRSERHLSIVNAAGAGLRRAVASKNERPRQTRLLGLLAAKTR